MVLGLFGEVGAGALRLDKAAALGFHGIMRRYLSLPLALCSAAKAGATAGGQVLDALVL
jgi:hypothetical protein